MIMKRIRIFISSVQSEFAEERAMLCHYIRTDVLLGKFFEPFIFEEVPANEYPTSHVYLKEVEQCDIYLGLYAIFMDMRMKRVFLLQNENMIWQQRFTKVA
jgi:hypothetical protein